MDLNGVLGLEVIDAEHILKNRGINYIVKETRGYKDTEMLKVPRVIMIKKKEKNIELIVTYFSNSLS